MGRYLVRRLGVGMVTILSSVTLIFFLIHLVPGDPVMAMLQDNYNEEAYHALRHSLGLDRPVAVQYAQYLRGALRGELGNSFQNHKPVAENLRLVMPYTLHLTLSGMLVATAFGIPAGVVAAVFRNRWPDYLSMVTALIGISTPSFGVGVVLMLVFALWLGWFPTVGVGTGWSGTLLHLVLPGLTIGLRAAGILARISRSAVLEVLGQDYIRTAVAKGLSWQRVLLKHALRNAAIPIVTVVGLEFGLLLGGTAVVEAVFARRGLGTVLVDGVRFRDFPLIQGALLLYMLVVLAINLVVDLAYGAIDPRIRYS